MGWLAMVAHWSETPMLAPLLFVAMLVVVAGYLWQNNWVRIGGALCSTVVMGLMTQDKAPPLIIPQVVSWLACIAAVLIPYLPALWQRLRTRARTVRSNIAWYGAVGSVTLLAIGVRAWQLDSIPIPVSDESASALLSLEIWHGSFTNPFISGWFEFPSLWFFLIAPFIGTFGKTFFAIRFFPMILGSACIPALIWAVRPVLPRQGALVAGLALAMLGIHIHFSRYGLNNIADSFSGIVLLGILLRYRHRSTFGLATAAGLTMGAAVYGYASARVFPLIVVLYIVALVVRAHHTWRLHLRNLVVMALVAMVVTGPLLVHYIEQPDQFWSVVRRSSIITREADGTSGIERWAAEHEQTVAEVVVRNIAYTMQALFWGPVEGWFGTPRAVLTIPLSALALIGAIGMVVRRQDSAVFAVAAWLAVCSGISAVNWPIAAGQRLVSLLGILALLIGFGTIVLSNVLRRYVNQRAIAVVLFALVSTGGVMSLDHYFNTFVKREAGIGDAQLHRAGIVALVAQQLPAYTWIDVYRSDVFNYETTPVLRYALMRIDANIITEVYPDQPLAPIIIYPIEAASRVVRTDNYVEYSVDTPEGEPTLIFAVRDDAPWAADVIRTVIEKNE
ncbi:MAG: hypothetical protein DWI54_00335 [Chloroflexi bacterium]|nr:MAG: hypothetical protein DWI54_00335 [Chloroflexota bacterium]